MCTVTYIPGKDAVFITSNRDEQITRGTAMAPLIHNHPGKKNIYPVDSDTGGTWIAARQNGDAMVLLNGGFEAHIPEASYRASRGFIFTEILQADHLCQHFDSINLAGIQPFTLVIFENQQLYECRWDGTQKYQAMLNETLSYIWSSVTLYDKPMRTQRESWFTQWMAGNPQINAETILALHETAGADKPDYAFMLKRSTVCTTSITSIKITSDATTMYYKDVDTGTVTTQQLSLNRKKNSLVGRLINLQQRFKTSLIKIFNWEYWPFFVLYTPIYAYWFWLCAKSKSFFFFNTANPRIKNGGFLLESKNDIYKSIPQELYPTTIFYKLGSSLEDVIASLDKKNLNYPLIAKPDIGMRGIAVKRLHSDTELKQYLLHNKVDFLIQECIEYPNEAGIFFYKIPGQPAGHISGIVGKYFVTLVGDGYSTIEQLLEHNNRYLLQLPSLKATNGALLKKILNTNESYTLVPIGNHARGALFVNLSNKITQELTNSVNEICDKIPDFYFGRIDIRYNSWEELCQGKNFSIIEINGAGSEPTHIYDPSQSVFFAWKEIIRHWKILHTISTVNHQLQGIPYMSTKAGWQMLVDNKKHVKLLSS